MGESKYYVYCPTFSQVIRVAVLLVGPLPTPGAPLPPNHFQISSLRMTQLGPFV